MLTKRVNCRTEDLRRIIRLRKRKQNVAAVRYLQLQLAETKIQKMVL